VTTQFITKGHGLKIKMLHKGKLFFSFFMLVLLLVGTSACSLFESIGQAQVTDTATVPPELMDTTSPTDTSTDTITTTSTETMTPTNTQTLTMTLSPTVTDTPSMTPSPTFDFPDVEVNVAAAHCRYGPSKSFLHAADLYQGDHGEVRGRFLYSDWLYVKFDKLDYYCWVSPYVVDLTGDISNINYQEPNLQLVGSFDLYTPTQNVRAYRKGDEVTITWDQVTMTEDDDRGYLIIAWVCQNSAYLWWTQSFENQFTTSYTVTDDGTCGGLQTSGMIYTVEKHGFSEPITIPWPPYQD